MRLVLFSLICVASLEAQELRIGILDFYGLRKVPEAQVRKVLGVREGDPLPPSKGAAEERLDKIKGVYESHLEAVCCEEGRMVLYVGIEEPGAAHFDLRDPPAAEIQLPMEVAEAYAQFLQESAAAIHEGITDEDLTHGYSLSADKATRKIQETFPALADNNVIRIRNVLRMSADEAQRAAAAYLLGYVTDKQDVINDLQYALKDPDDGVRSNATHSLTALAVLARLDPKSGIRIEPTWFIEMLNSLSWSDRNRAAKALDILTESRDRMVLDQLRARSLPALVEMARWKVLSHALPAFLVLGRVAGLPEQQIQDAWSSGDRQSVIAAATGVVKGKNAR